MINQQQSVASSTFQLAKWRQTSLGLYVTAQEAYEKWKADPVGVKVLDVRTPEEYMFVGHPAMARNIPVAFVNGQWDADKNDPVWVPNPDFVVASQKAFSPTDTILVMCRSGGRSEVAIDELAKVGFTNAYNIIDGMEGDLVDDPGNPGNVYHGKRMRNGWKNSGLPWTYEVDPDLLWTPTR